MELFEAVPKALQDLAEAALTPEGAGQFLMTALELAGQYGEADPMPRLMQWTYPSTYPQEHSRPRAPWRSGGPGATGR